MIHIHNIRVTVTEPLNILPDGTMDPAKTKWCFGGTTYKVYCSSDLGTYSPETHFTIEVQLEGNQWYSPDYDYASTSLIEVLEFHRAIDLDYEAYCLSQQQVTADKT